MTETKTNFQILNELITNHIMTILSGYIQTSPNCLTLNSITPNRYAFRSIIAA